MIPNAAFAAAVVYERPRQLLSPPNQEGEEEKENRRVTDWSKITRELNVKSKREYEEKK